MGDFDTVIKESGNAVRRYSQKYKNFWELSHSLDRADRYWFVWELEDQLNEFDYHRPYTSWENKKKVCLALYDFNRAHKAMTISKDLSNDFKYQQWRLSTTKPWMYS